MWSHPRLPWSVAALAACWCLAPSITAGQELTGALIGMVRDAQGAAVQSAHARVASPSLIGGSITVITNERGQYRLVALPPGVYSLEIERDGFATFRETAIDIGVSETIERTIELKLAGVAESVVVEGAGSHIDSRNPGFSSRVTADDLRAIPSRRTSMFDAIRASPGISPTSPSGASNSTVTTVSAFGSGTNENQFLIDGTNFTCPCNGVARSEPGYDFIQEVQVQSVGASAEYGNVQGAVINVVTRQGSERWQSDVSYYWQPEWLTSQPVILTAGSVTSGYERVHYRDLTGSVGGPVSHDRLWIFAGYEYLRDSDSQPGADPAFPRAYEQNKVFGKLTWSFGPNWRLIQSVHNERWAASDPPTSTTPYETVAHRSATVPAITFGELTHVASSTTVWNARAAYFLYDQLSTPPSGDFSIPNRTNQATGVQSGAPALLGSPRISRTTAKATISHFLKRAGDHQLKAGGQVEEGGHQATNIVPTGARYLDNAGVPLQRIATAPYNVGARFFTMAAFASDALTLGDRATLNVGLRFDHTRAFSQDLAAIDTEGHETGTIIPGRGTVYTWNILSPRLGITARLSDDGRTMLRASYGRFSQGVMTGELEQFHPGATPTITTAYDSATGDYTRPVSTVDPQSLLLDGDMKAPYSDEYSIGVDRAVGSRLSVATAYVHKDGRQLIGWTDVGGHYQSSTRTLSDGRILPVWELTNGTGSRRYELTNIDDYSSTYNGLVLALEKRYANHWQALGSYTLSRATGLISSSGTTPAGPQVTTVAPPQSLTFGRDPNDLTNAAGILPNDRTHAVRAMTSIDVPNTGLSVAASFQYFTGKPWTESAQVSLPQSGNAKQRILIEPRGSQRLPSQSLLDVRVSERVTVPRLGRLEILLDILNTLNDDAAESLTTDVFDAPNFAQPTIVMDPRRVMIGVRMNVGR